MKTSRGQREGSRIKRLALRHKTLSKYSAGKYVCACCGSDEYELLEIDHIAGNGAEHRTDVWGRPDHVSSDSFYYWLRRNNYPKGYAVLCGPCNTSKGDQAQCQLHPIDPYPDLPLEIWARAEALVEALLRARSAVSS